MTLRSFALCGILSGCVLTLPLSAGNWPQWRGSSGDGVSEETGLPVAWSEKLGVVWRCPLPPWGNSTPAIWGDAVFVTSHVDNRELVLLRIDKATGKPVWQRTVALAQAPSFDGWGKKGDRRRRQEFHRDHNMATPSPVTDGELVIAHFGSGDLAAYDFDGQEIWRRNLQDDHGPYTIWWGHGNSPILYGDLVVSVCMQDSCADLPGDPSISYVAAHHKRTGELVWYTERMTAATDEHCDSYTTPVLWNRNGRPEIVVMGGQMLDAYNPLSGERLWWLPDLVGNRVVPTPVTGHGMVYAIQGMREALLAVRPDKDGPLTRDSVVWSDDQGTSDSPSLLLVGELLFMVNNQGIVRCYGALDGRLKWKERLRGNYRASPVLAERRIYFLNMDGLCTVVGATDRFQRLAENQLDDRTLASPAVSGGRLFIRGHNWLYCLGR
ncbi:MAG: PQQ-binding-like beta-propeller repeat protein [Thermoguttaceae bacterium]|jgi:outer membrane protein assembly factor BamB|nr:PQQ-binding-like beta-propeller repeat protein [Thermoguttaceae bacterium]